MRSSFVVAVLPLVLCFAGAVVAAPAAADPGFSLGANVGTAGAGFEGTVSVMPRFVDLRAGNGFFNYQGSGSSTGLNFSGGVHLNSFDTLIDLHPLANSLRLSTGLVYANNSFSFSGVANAGASYTINGHTYTTEQIGGVNGSATFGGTNPFIGIGLGGASTPRVGTSVTFDAGVVLEPSAIVSLSTTRNNLPPAQQAQLKSDLAQTQSNLQNSLGFVRTYPLVRLGIAFHV